MLFLIHDGIRVKRVSKRGPRYKWVVNPYDICSRLHMGATGKATGLHNYELFERYIAILLVVKSFSFITKDNYEVYCYR